jgi:hypothetical protein
MPYQSSFVRRQRREIMKIRLKSSPVFAAILVVLLTALACTMGSQPPAATDEPAQLVPVAGPTSTPGITHLVQPGELPAERSNHAGDQDSSTTAYAHRAPGGDRLSVDQFERPFNADKMDIYFQYLDIQDTTVFEDDTWIYMNIVLKGPDENGHLSGRYAAEVDTNLDGRGDWFIVATAPASTAWSTDGVQAWRDLNHDVGGGKPIWADKQSGGNGYDDLVVDSGKGDDSDAAWARVSPQDPNSVQIAFKKSLVGSPADYLLGAWSGADKLDPALFDLNDHFTNEQAGSPLPDFATYPLKQLPALDNTCRMSVGFEATGREPGVCQSAVNTSCSNSCPQYYIQNPYPDCSCYLP